MSSTLDRLRKLHGLRPKQTRDEPKIPKDNTSKPPIKDPVYVDFVEPTARPTVNGSTVNESTLAGYAFDYCATLEEVVPGQEITNDSGVCYLVTRAYPLNELRGPMPLQNLLNEQPATFATHYPKFNLSVRTDFRKAAFIDTETTGLGVGAGVYCFMIGIGTFEHLRAQSARDISQLSPIANFVDAPTHFVVRQFFMRSPDEEVALLVAVDDSLRACDMTVTFNGRTFDLPMLRARFRQNRYALPPTHEKCPLLAETKPHLDLLMPARRLWRRRLGSCRLVNLEEKILGIARSAADVPGHLIPMLYTEYARSGEAGAMPGIFYHNCEDIVSMVGLAERLCYAYTTSPSQADQANERHVTNITTTKTTATEMTTAKITATEITSSQITSTHLTAQSSESEKARKIDDLHGHEWLALGDSHERVGDIAQAEIAFQRSIYLLSFDESGEQKIHRADAFRRLGLLQKRQNRWSEAIETWQLWLSSVSGLDPTPYIELAKYFEWQNFDLAQAEMWTSWALHNLQSSPIRSVYHRHIPQIKHRLARIQRKKKATSNIQCN